MRRNVFFSFHYDDIMKVNQVRNAKIVKPSDGTPFIDRSLWEDSPANTKIGLKREINAGLERTTVTAVLIGEQTYSRPWVRYELLRSFERGNGLLAISLKNVKKPVPKTALLPPPISAYSHGMLGAYYEPHKKPNFHGSSILMTGGLLGQPPIGGCTSTPVTKEYPNPLEYLGYTYNKQSGVIKLYEYRNNSWIDPVDGPSVTSINRINYNITKESGKLTDFINTTYDWKLDDGYNNFPTWAAWATRTAGKKC